MKTVTSKKGFAVFAILILGCLFFFFSSSSSSGDKKAYFEENIETEEYVSSLESRLEKKLSSLKNAGKTEVMITLEGSGEYVYQFNTDDSENTENGEGGSAKASREAKNSTVIIKNSSGNELPVLKNRLSPEIEGVLVICEGGDRADVKENVSKAVKALLGISSNKICVLTKN